MHAQNNLPTLVDPFPVSLISKAAEDRPEILSSGYLLVANIIFDLLNTWTKEKKVLCL